MFQLAFVAEAPVSEESPILPRKNPRQRRSRELVAAILDATARVLVEDGYAGATTNRIAEVAGVSVGSLYQYFPNKDALVWTLGRAHVEDQLAKLALALAERANGPAPDLIRAVVEAVIASHALDPALHRALSEQLLAIGLHHIADVQAQARAAVRAWLIHRQDELMPCDPDAAAWLLVTSVEGVVHGALLDDPGRLRDPAFSAELVAMVSRYLLGGPGPPEKNQRPL